MINLRNHQKIAIKKTLKNNFESGVHFHATGTGKSIIALNILLEYHKKYPNRNLMWFCEQKTILFDLFNNSKVIKFINENFNNLKIFNLIDKKDKTFINTLNNLLQQNYLLIINRAYLSYNDRYLNVINFSN